MPARSPEEVHELFTRYFAQGDLDALASLYEPDATLLAQPGQTVSGVAAIREALAGFLALKGEFRLARGESLATRDIALLFSAWTLSATGPDGGRIDLAGQTSDVVRRQADGTWLIAIDNPYGAAGMT